MPSANIRDTPDLVLLDLKLPKIGGHHILKRIRETEQTRRIPVVILTSSNEEADVERACHCGANSYVRKPVDAKEFLESVSHLGLYWLAVNEPAPRTS